MQLLSEPEDEIESQRHFWAFHTAPCCRFSRNPTYSCSEELLPAPSLQQALTWGLDKVEWKSSFKICGFQSGSSRRSSLLVTTSGERLRRFSRWWKGYVITSVTTDLLIWPQHQQPWDSFQRKKEAGTGMLCSISAKFPETPRSAFPKTCPWGSSASTWINLSWLEWEAVFGELFNYWMQISLLVFPPLCIKISGIKALDRRCEHCMDS